MFITAIEIIDKIKKDKPLILNITNDVTMDFVANGLLCVGGLPIMSRAIQEANELLHIASSVVINPGTLDDKFITLSQTVCSIANQLNKPIILDPVGAGASHYRTSYCRELLKQFKIAIVRGNASEIMALAGDTNNTKGVDSTLETQAAIDSAKILAKESNLTVVISGKTDAIVDNNQISLLNRGSPLMPLITGTGCLLSAVVAAFHAVHSNQFEAAQAATLFYSVCGEIAAQTATTPGSFKTAFLDALYKQPHGVDYAN